jgi:para-aminobenzoate synthetase/4-amino-4-deoxychorismate lyase
MVRNDFGYICAPGTINVDPLFHVDTYQTVHQMISGVKGKLTESCSLSTVLKALFPAASITGAPKVRATGIINELEYSPRKVYTGAIGCVLPNNNACFNVPIRTLICEATHTELGIGSGIVADSNPESEWEECLTKKKFSNSSYPDFDILETILWTRKEGFKYLADHLERAEQSQRYFGRKWQAEKVNKALKNTLFEPEMQYARARLLVSRDGNAQTEVYPMTQTGWDTSTPLKVYISNRPTNSNDIFLYHKTTNRAFYNKHFRNALNAGYADCIFVNEKGEVTEGAISNIFIKLNNKWLTPPLSSGLLAGIWRKHQLKNLKATEQVIYLDDLKSATEILIGNSVRGSGNVTQVTTSPQTDK